MNTFIKITIKWIWIPLFIYKSFNVNCFNFHTPLTTTSQQLRQMARSCARLFYWVSLESKIFLSKWPSILLKSDGSQSKGVLSIIVWFSWVANPQCFGQDNHLSWMLLNNFMEQIPPQPESILLKDIGRITSNIDCKHKYLDSAPLEQISYLLSIPIYFILLSNLLKTLLLYRQ